MTLTIEDLDTCSPDAIDAVAASWEKLSAAMSGDEASVDRDVIGPLASGWVSEDGRNAIRLVGFVGDQLEAVRAESGAMASILREAAGKIRTAQNALRQALEEARINHLTRQTDGSFTWQASSDADNSNLKAIAEDLVKRIGAALQQASEADTLAALTMKANVDSGPTKDFNTRSLGADPIADAQRTADILSRLGSKDGLSATDLQELKLLGLDNTGNTLYQTQLIRDLGPDGLLTATRLTTPPWLVNGVGPEDLKYIQDTLRNSLSAASPELAKDKAWMDRLKEAGRDVVVDPRNPLSGNVTYGYQSLSVLIRDGAYDTDFLKTVGRDVLDYDKELLQRGIGWGTEDPTRDPVNGYLTALKNNPTAASQVFAGEQGRKDLDYLANDRILTTGPTGWGPSARAHLDPLGAAIAVATKVGTDPTQMNSIVSNVVDVLGKDGSSALDQSKPLRDGVTQMLVANPATLHAGLTQPLAGNQWGLTPPGFEPAPVARDHMVNVLNSLADDRKSMVALQHTEQFFTWQGLSAYGPPPDMAVPGAYAAWHDKVTAFAQSSAQAFGALDRVVGDEIRRDQLGADGSFNSTVHLVERIGGPVAAAAATFVHGPTVGGVPTGEWIGDVLAIGVDKGSTEIANLFEQDTSDAASKQIAEAYTEHNLETWNTLLIWQEQFNQRNPGLDLNIMSVADAGYGTGESITKGTQGHG